MKHQANTPSEVVAASSIVRISGNEAEVSRLSMPAPELPVPDAPILTKSAREDTAPQSISTIPFHKSPTLYVGDLHADVGEAALYDIFQALGPIQSIRICRDRVSGRSLGYGYINFAALHDAERALTAMNYFSGPQTFGRPLRLMWSMRDPSSRRQGAGNIFVKGLAKSIDCKTLHDTFSQFGRVWSCKVATDESGTSLGYGFVHFECTADAKTAISKVDGMLLDGAKVHVGHFKRRQERVAAGLVSTKFTNIYVKNLDDTLCEEDALRELFQEYGEITSVYVPRNEDGTPKKFAFLNFACADKARRAVAEMHGRVVNKCGTNASSVEGGDGEMSEIEPLYVCRAQKKSERLAELRKKFAIIRRERAERHDGQNVYVKNLHTDVDDNKLRNHFARAGTITSCVVMRDSRNYSRGFGFVCYSSKAEANRAVEELSGSLLDTKQLYVAIAQRKGARRAQIRAQRAPFMPWLATATALAGAHPHGSPHFLPPGAMYAQPTPYVYRHAPPPPTAAAFVAPPQPPASGVNPRMPPQFPPAFLPHSPVFAPHLRYPAPPNVPRFVANTQVSMVAQQLATTAAYPPLSVAASEPQDRRNHAPNHDSFIAQVPHNIRAPSANGAVHATKLRDVATAPAPAPVAPELEPLTVDMLTAATPAQRKDMLGVRLYPRVAARNSEQATKITGMLLELDDPDVLHLLDTPQALAERIEEAQRVLHEHAESIAKEQMQSSACTAADTPTNPAANLRSVHNASSKDLG